MTDIAHIIQVELDRLNHSGEAFANYGRHVAATLSRLAAPPLEKIAADNLLLELSKRDVPWPWTETIHTSPNRIAKEIRALKPSEGKSVSYDSVSPDEAAEYVRKERERNANRDKSYPVPSDGFINDYD